MAPLISVRSLTEPTRTTLSDVTRVLLAPRQATTTVVSTSSSGSSGLSGGAIAGIVIGSIAGFLLLLWIIRSCTNLGEPGAWGDRFGEPPEKPPSRHPSGVYREERYYSPSRHSRRSSRRRSVSVQPVYVEQRGRSPRAPQRAYQPRRSSRREYYG